MRILLCFLFLNSAVHANEWETAAVVSLKAYHFNAGPWEEWNPGLSFEARKETESFSFGLIRDSLGNISPHAGMGLHYPMGRWSAGLNLQLIYRQENQSGDKVGLLLAPLPTLDYRGERYGFGLLFIPKPTDEPGDSAALLFMLRIQFGD